METTSPNLIPVSWRNGEAVAWIAQSSAGYWFAHVLRPDGDRDIVDYHPDFAVEDFTFRNRGQAEAGAVAWASLRFP